MYWNMKKILLAISTIIALVACNKEIELPEMKVEENDVILNLGFVVPEAQTATKSFTDPSIVNLRVIVFDENGYLVEVKDAEKNSTGLGTKDQPIDFTVSLKQSVSPRSLHFVANVTGEISFGMEKDIMTSLTTSDNQDSYWQCVPVDRILKDDSDLQTKLSNIPLVRNFAKIKIAALPTGTNFTLLEYKLVNIPTRGTVAPYNMEKNSFQSFYENNGTGVTASTYDQLSAASYIGFMPDQPGNKESASIVFDADFTGTEADPYGALYTYESTYGNGLAIIVKGQYGNEAPSYYKIDLVNNGTNYHILRNFEYSITIQKVNGSGYSSETDAITNPAGNNVNYSSETQSLINISDGTSRLYVEYTSKRIVSDDPVTLKYKYIPNIKDLGTDGLPKIDNSSVSYTLDATFIKNVSDPSSADGWNEITLDPKDDFYTSGILEGSITLTAGSLSRKVMLYRLAPYVITSLSAADTDGYVTLTINLPYIHEDVFPLVLDIVDSKQMLSAYTLNGVAMPVKIDNTNKCFYYQRTLTLDEYQQNNQSIKCYFKTNQSGTTTITVSNQYFTSKECTYTKQ